MNTTRKSNSSRRRSGLLRLKLRPRRMLRSGRAAGASLHYGNKRSLGEEKGGEAGMDSGHLKDLKDVTEEDRKVVRDLEEAEKSQGVPHPEEKKLNERRM